MTQQNPFADWYKSWESAVKDATSRVPSLDFNSALEAGQKNAEAFAATQKAVVESVQTVAKLQAEAAQKSVEGALKLFNEIATSKDPRESAAKQADYAKSVLADAASNAQEIADITSKSQNQVAELVGAQFSDSIKQFNDVAEKVAPTAKAEKKAAA